jgi:hypothetical protein
VASEKAKGVVAAGIATAPLLGIGFWVYNNWKNAQPASAYKTNFTPGPGPPNPNIAGSIITVIASTALQIGGDVISLVKAAVDDATYLAAVADAQIPLIGQPVCRALLESRGISSSQAATFCQTVSKLPVI